MHTDRLGQVAVTVGIARHQLAKLRQHLERIPVVGFLQRLGDGRELQHQQLAARLEHAVHLLERDVLVRHVAQAEGHGRDIKIVVGKRQLLGVADHRGQRHAGIKQTVSPGAQHGFVDVGVDHLTGRADLLGKSHCQVAGATRDVEHARAFAHIGDQHRVGLPGAMQAQRHQVVHQVVARRNRVEHAPYALRLLRFVDRFKSEMGGTHRFDVRVIYTSSSALTPPGRGVWAMGCEERDRTSGRRGRKGFAEVAKNSSEKEIQNEKPKKSWFLFVPLLRNLCTPSASGSPRPNSKPQ